MKKTVLMALFLIAIAFAAKSQPAQRWNPEQRVQTLMAEVKAKMNLSPEKLSQVESMYTSYYKEMAELRQNSQGSFDREKMMERRQKFSEKLLTVLTKSEHDQLLEIEQSFRRQGRPQAN